MKVGVVAMTGFLQTAPYHIQVSFLSMLNVLVCKKSQDWQLSPVSEISDIKPGVRGPVTVKHGYSQLALDWTSTMKVRQ